MLLRSLHVQEETQQALLPLLWSLLDVLHPHSPQAQPSLGAQEAIIRSGHCGWFLARFAPLLECSCAAGRRGFNRKANWNAVRRSLGQLPPLPRALPSRSMLARLLEQGGPLAQLLPPFTAPPPGTGGAAAVAKALHSFWTAAASNALLCCKQPVWEHLADAKRQQYQSLVLADAAPRLLPRDMEAAANAAVNTVSGLSSQLAQKWTVNVEPLCQQLSAQLDIMRREAAAGSGAAAELPPPPARFRPADFPWTLAEAAMHLIAAFLHAQPCGGEGGTQPDPAAEGAAARAAGGEPQRWQDLQPGQQWALACFPAVARVIFAGGKMARPLWPTFFPLQMEWQQGIGDKLVPKGVCVKPPASYAPPAAPPMPRGMAPAAEAEAAAAMAEQEQQPEASCMGGNSILVLQRQQPQQPPGARAAAPAASSMGGGAAAARPAQQLRVQAKQEPLSQPAGPAALPQRSQQPPAAQQPRQQAQRLDRDVPFGELLELPSRSVVHLVGFLRRRPAVKVRRGAMRRLLGLGHGGRWCAWSSACEPGWQATRTTT